MTLLDKYESYTIENFPWKDNWHANAMIGGTSLVSHGDPFVDFTFTIQMILKPLVDDKSKEVLLIDNEKSSEWYTMIFDYKKMVPFLSLELKKL